MFRKLSRVLAIYCVCYFLSTAALAQTIDAIDLHKVVVHSAPTDVADWPQTVALSTLTMRPTGQNPEGLVFDTTAPIPQRWDFHVPGWGADPAAPCPADGCVLYTVWPIVQVNGTWHTSGIIQMWRGRPSTGAPILTDFHKNWAYARDRWGEMFDYNPQPGDQVGFFITAGNARSGGDFGDKRERSQVVLVRLPAGDRGVFEFSGSVVPVDPPAPTPGTQGPPGPQGPKGDKGDKGDPGAGADTAVLNDILARLVALEGRAQVLESKPVPASCSASLNLGATRIPISCRLNP